jgi:hypothetical protein
MEFSIYAVFNRKQFLLESTSNSAKQVITEVTGLTLPIQQELPA